VPASPLDISVIDTETAKPHILYSSNWIRILLVRRPDDSANSIEVELTYPGVLGLVQTKLAETIMAMISHLRYILRLQKVGFALDSIEDDFLWTATLEISEEPETQLFEILIPP
jgi:hypothetical protein